MTTVWVLTITYKHGTDSTVHRTEEGALNELDQYCQLYWSDFCNEEPIPDTQEERCHLYFSKAEGEDLYDLSEREVKP